MHKILYIGVDTIAASDGGDVVNMRNLNALKAVYENNFYNYALIRRNKMSVMYNLLLGNVGFIRSADYKKIIQKIDILNINDVFLWSSKLGKLAKYIKKHRNSVRVISFFHNVEQHYYNEELLVNNSFRNRLIAKIVTQNERQSSQWSDFLITLNKRDSNLLEKYYHRQANLELPTSFDDKFDGNVAKQYTVPKEKEIINLLFVGSSFFANNHAAQWFIDNILPRIEKAHFTIVGKNMDQVFFSTDNITVHGFVDDLAPFYYATDIVVQPVFIGGGMKTKMAEALMYGCAIIGTSESFEGYELDYEKVGGLADDADTMISKILYLASHPDNIIDAKTYAREIFNQKYNISSTITTLKQKLYNE